MLFRLCSKYVIWKVRKYPNFWSSFRHDLAMALLDNFMIYYPPSKRKEIKLNDWDVEK